MNEPIDRRSFLGTMGGVAASAIIGPPLVTRLHAQPHLAPAPAGRAGPMVLRPFDYQGVTLLPGRWQRQYDSALEFYLAVPDDDILHGFRQAAGLPAPGRPLGGWAATDSSTVFGQWLQAMTRAARTNGDAELRDKAFRLIDGWARTLGADGSPRMRHYPWEKLLGGLSDAHQYTGHPTAPRLMERITDWAILNLDRTRTPAANHPWELHSGTPLEWYTLSENLYRAYLLTGDARYKEFGDVWRYDSYWDRFADTSQPPGAQGVHAYSHVNSFSGAALAYMIEGDPRLLGIMKNFYDFLQDSQCYATGGYGPAERFLYHDGALGQSLEARLDSFESPCCSWAAFKLGRYLTTLTGEARYGDWIERLVYNGVGAALPIRDNGRHFYYADFSLGAGMKVYARSTYTCCSGTYFQDVVEYQNLVYFQDDAALYVNLYLPSTVEWTGAGQPVKVTQETAYPEADTIDLRIGTSAPVRFPLHLRIPGWSSGVTLTVNGTAASVPVRPGEWATIQREWSDGDHVRLTLPLRWRRVPIDRWHPDRIAIVRGPVVYAQMQPHKNAVLPPPDDDALNDWFIPTDDPVVFAFKGQVPASQRDDFMPYYRFEELARYRMYFDPSTRTDLW
jgi:uncharacterized protein